MRASLADQCWIFVDGDERPGVFVYALAPADACLASFESDVIRDAKPFSMAVGEWLVWSVKMRLSTGLSDAELIEVLRALADELLLFGATVVWFGGEDSTWNPGVLDPARSYGNVLAAAIEPGRNLIRPTATDPGSLGVTALEPIWSRLCDLGVPADLGAERAPWPLGPS